MRRLTMYRVIVVVGLLAAAGCSAGAGSSSARSSTASGQASNSVLTISNASGALWTCGFNPFNPNDDSLSVGFNYEPLVYVNPLLNGKTTPMLATSWSWGPGDKSLTFTIHPGVKWSDGTPMSAADVAYTFNLIKKYPALDLTGVWPVLSSVTATGSRVTMDFSSVAVPYFYSIADLTPIVPEHIWSKIANPATDSIKNPVGTGPYLMSKCSPQNITYTANPHYWQPGLPKISKLEYPAFTSNDPANEMLASGQAQWGAQYIPDIDAYYASKSPNNHYWFPPTVNIALIPNLTNSLLSNVEVRQAMSYAINRAQVSTIGESGYEPPANQTGVVTPTFSSSLDNSALASWGNGYDPAKAKALLESAGFHLGSDGIMTNAAGDKLQFTIINVGDFSDWVASVQVIQQDLKAIGIAISPDNLSSNDFVTDLHYGKYQLAYSAQPTLGPGVFYELDNWLNSANTARVGKSAATNVERYTDSATDSLLKQYAASTSTTAQQSILDQLQQVMVSQVPIIPVVELVDWYQYSTASFTGWPTASNPYARPPVWAYPDNEQVLLHLSPK